jgi:hypothetical protein
MMNVEDPLAGPKVGSWGSRGGQWGEVVMDRPLLIAHLLLQLRVYKIV